MDQAPEIFHLLVSKGAIIYTIDIWNRLWKQPLNDKMIRSEEEFESLLDVTDPSLFKYVMGVIFGQESIILERKVDYKAKILTLLAWKYDNSSLFSTLPKEILTIILQHLDNMPLFIQYAHLIMKRNYKQEFIVPNATLESTEHVARFVRDYCAVFKCPWQMLQYGTMKPIERDIKYIEEIFMTVIDRPVESFSSHHLPERILMHLCKYCTNDQILTRILDERYKVYYAHRVHMLEYAALGRNIKFLQLYYKNPANYHMLPQSMVFNCILNSKVDKITFKEALELVEEVRQSVTDRHK